MSVFAVYMRSFRLGGLSVVKLDLPMLEGEFYNLSKESMCGEDIETVGPFLLTLCLLRAVLPDRFD